MAINVPQVINLFAISAKASTRNHPTDLSIQDDIEFYDRFNSWTTQHIARSDIETGAVPGANNLGALQFTFVQRTICVCTQVVGRVKIAIHVVNSDRLTINVYKFDPPGLEITQQEFVTGQRLHPIRLRCGCFFFQFKAFTPENLDADVNLLAADFDRVSWKRSLRVEQHLTGDQVILVPVPWTGQRISIEWPSADRAGTMQAFVVQCVPLSVMMEHADG